MRIVSLLRSMDARVLLTAIVLAGPGPAHAEPPLKLKDWVVQPFQPPIKPGGRANTIAVHPKDASLIFVTSESGGLFRSRDGGKNWTHVDSLPVFFTNAVAFAQDPKVVIVTASEDFSVANRGGIWRSTDGGETWTETPSPPTPSRTQKRLSAWGISIASDTGRIFVASTYGVLASDDPQGASWNTSAIDVFGYLKDTYDKTVVSVVALPVTSVVCAGAQGGNLLLAGGPSGIRRSADGGKTWCGPIKGTGCVPGQKKDPQGCIEDMHAFGRSPLGNDNAYVAAPRYKGDEMSMELYRTTDGGDTWALEHPAPRVGRTPPVLPPGLRRSSGRTSTCRA